MPVFRDDSPAEITAALTALPARSSVAVVAERLLELFTSGSIAAGTRLPPERQLAATLEVGRSAVREALAALEILGIVDVRPGSGTYLRGTASELLPQTLSWGMLIGEHRTSELLEVRSGLEIYVARLAAERLTDDELARLSAHLDEMAEAADDLHAFVAADLAFHQDLARAADNGVLLDLLQIVRSLLRVWVDRAVQDPSHAATALAEHRAVYDALAARDADRAASAMAAHMATASARLQSAPA
ncbi:FadR/GntR family transcriptional regulator [Agromyces mangrovi Wang et al. 2018]|uniref:FadR/GntR family transcriptional regulator n=1 Tax=Agromyces mangrovi TaxID=1858653 RepID=UPI00257314C7|nr:FCD domain-containing protein [Agromyces mangrovi]